MDSPELLHLRIPRQRQIMPQNLWTLLLGLAKTRLDFLHSRRELSHLAMDETPNTWRQSFVFAPASINLSTTPHPPLYGSPKCFLLTLWKSSVSTSNNSGWYLFFSIFCGICFNCLPYRLQACIASLHILVINLLL